MAEKYRVCQSHFEHYWYVGVVMMLTFVPLSKFSRITRYLVPFVIAMLFCIFVPLRTRAQFGPDEGYELIKATLVLQGHPLYYQVWSDQPPLYTEALVLLFHVAGPSAYVARLLTVALSVVLCCLLFSCVRTQSGELAAICSVLLLMTSSLFWQISASAMVEIPSIALSLACVWALFKFLTANQVGWLVLSGVLFGCALQTKLTSAMLLPALLVELFANLCWDGSLASTADRKPGAWSSFALWSGTIAASFAVVLVAFYNRGAFRAFWCSHFLFSETYARAAQSFRFRPESLLNERSCGVAILGALLACGKHRRCLRFPFVLFSTIFVIHLFHRPYWPFYALHFMVPMAWLGGHALVYCLCQLPRVVWTHNGLPLIASQVFTSVFAAVAMLTLVSLPNRICDSIGQLQAETWSIEDGQFVNALRRNAATTHWIYTDRAIYAFWAQLPVIPELAVMPMKRFWSGEIDDARILKALVEYRPEQILFITNWEDRPLSLKYVMTYYRVEKTSFFGTLFLRK